MTLNSKLGVSLIALSMVSAAVAQADTAPAAPKPTLTFQLEITPEFYASDKVGSYSKGDLADDVAKISISKALPNGFNIGASIAATMREAGITGQASAYNQLEVSTSYKFKLTPELSITPSGTLGYAFGDLPKIDPLNAGGSVAYYAVAIGADYKLAPGLTWNVINIRYRDAFSVNWATPKVSTGVTYALDDTNSAYMNIGKSWKDTGTGYKSDKYSVAFGIKHAF